MPNYHRYYIPNAIVFITVVTRNRIQYLLPSEDVTLFFNTMKHVRLIHPFHLRAYVILPDHFHWLMRVENDKGEFSQILNSLKHNYTKNYKVAHHISTSLSLWQDRFWDHVIRNEQDLNNHFDYIHWNPVKHGFVESPEDWNYSTYRFWCDRGYYHSRSDSTKIPSNIGNMDFE